jgi:tRNA (pseudouridine54-N1)-methyltransferase
MVSLLTKKEMFVLIKAGRKTLEIRKGNSQSGSTITFLSGKEQLTLPILKKQTGKLSDIITPDNYKQAVPFAISHKQALAYIQNLYGKQDYTYTAYTLDTQATHASPPTPQRAFILYSRLGRTDHHIRNLHDAGRLDIVYECIITSLFLSHAIRKNVTFHAILNGPPNPPLRLKAEGATLHDVRTDQATWTQIFTKTLKGEPHPGITMDKTSFETLIKTKHQTGQPIYILEEKGTPIQNITIQPNPVFVLGDHVGLPRNAERFALRYGTKISLGRTPYLAMSCIAILNYLLDTIKPTTKATTQETPEQKTPQKPYQTNSSHPYHN